MVLFSKPISNTCTEYVHPWTNSCLEATCGLYFYAIYDSMRIYATVYLVSLNHFTLCILTLSNVLSALELKAGHSVHEHLRKSLKH